MNVRIEDLTEDKLDIYRQFRCSHCCYFIDRNGSLKNIPYMDKALNKAWEEWYRKMLVNFGPCVKVALDNGKVIGMIMFSPIDLLAKDFNFKDRPYLLFREIPVWDLIPTNQLHNTLFVYCIYIPDKSYEGKGIGKMLLQNTIDKLRKPHQYLKGGKFSQIVLIAGKKRPGPAGPEEFFSKFGFQPVKETVDSVIMTLKLP